MPRHLDLADLERRQKRNKIRRTLWWSDFKMWTAGGLIVAGLWLTGTSSVVGWQKWFYLCFIGAGIVLFANFLLTYPSDELRRRVKSMPTAPQHDDSSPWWACPECGGIEFHAVVVFEKGQWEDDDTYEFEYPPTGFVNSVKASVLECVRCHHRFSPAEKFGWTTPAEVPN